MNKPKFNTVLKSIENAMEEVYINQANGEPCSDDIYIHQEQALELGIGAVLVPKASGHMGWLCLETLEF